MSATGKTENFNLPLYNADDATSWLVDFNGAMTDIDSHLKTLTDNVATDGEDLDNLENSVANLNKSVTQLTDSVIKVQETGKSNTSAITLLQTHDNEQDTRLSSLETDSTNLNNEITEIKDFEYSAPESIEDLKIVKIADGSNIGKLTGVTIEKWENPFLKNIYILGRIDSKINESDIVNVLELELKTVLGIDIIPHSVIANVEINHTGTIIPAQYSIYASDNTAGIDFKVSTEILATSRFKITIHCLKKRG